MACFKPLQAWRAPGGGASFSPSSGYTDLEPLNLPCGQCIGCRLDRSREWATRCVHEAQYHAERCFLTLTYADPKQVSLDRTHFRLFVKRLRKRTHRAVKYFHCGEYGELLRRPHYHALLFGYEYPDARRWKSNAAGDAIYRSDQLDQEWGLGLCSIGPVTFETAAYTARYVCKKVNGDLAGAHYGQLEPEYMSCSKGIGAAWIRDHAGDTYRDDFVVMRGQASAVPRYYDKKFRALDPLLFRRVQLDRLRAGNTRQVRFNRTPERLNVREEVTRARLDLHKGAF